MSRLGFLAGVVSLLGVSGSAWGSIEITEQLLTIDPASDFDAVAAEREVVFSSDRFGTTDVLIRDVNGLAPVLAGGAGAQDSPRFSNGFVVYTDNVLGDDNIGLVNLSDRVPSLVTVDANDDFAPAISGNNLVFVSNRFGSDDIFTVDITVGVVTPITVSVNAFEASPSIDGDLIAWEVFESGEFNIMATWLGATPFAVSTGAEVARAPWVSGDRIAYLVDGDVEVFNVVTQERTRVTSDVFFQRNVRISGDVVAWNDDRNGNADVFLYDFVDGQRYQVTSSPFAEAVTDLSADRVLFIDDRLGDFNISEVAFDINHPPVADAGNDQSVLVGDTVTLQGSATDIDGDSIVSWAWTVDSAPEGSVATIVDPTIPNPTFMPDLAGQYVFNLVVNDGRDDSAVASVTIEVAPTPASAQVPFSIGFIPVLVILTLGLGLRQVN